MQVQEADVESDAPPDAGEGTVLPPIGGLKAKRDSKQKPITTLKNAGSSTLQKSVPIHGVGGVAAGSTSMSSADPMSVTNPHSWHGHGSETNKMNSTWAPHGDNSSAQQRRYVSTFGAKQLPNKRR